MDAFRRIAAFAVLGTATALAAFTFKQNNEASELEKSRGASLLNIMRQEGTKDLDRVGFKIGGMNGHFKTDGYLIVQSDKPLEGFEPVAVVGERGEGLKYELVISRAKYNEVKKEFSENLGVNPSQPITPSQ